jgi:hypothetical protein
MIVSGALEGEKILLISVWHPVNGKWMNITQILRDGQVDYYTDGVQVHFPEEAK